MVAVIVTSAIVFVVVPLLVAVAICILLFFFYTYDKEFDRFDPSSPNDVPHVPSWQMEPFERELANLSTPSPGADLFGNTIGLKRPDRVVFIDELSDE